jgi:hypothetical protein
VETHVKYQATKERVAMVSQAIDHQVELIEGTIQQIDTISREVVVYIDGAWMCFDVPADCPVLLNRERVKLRLLQPTDRVRVAYCDEDGRHRARVIEV